MENLSSFEKILIAVDDSELSYNAAAYGFKLAHKLNAEVAIIHINEMPVVMNVTGDPILGDSGIIIPEVMDIQKDAAEKLLENLVLKFGKGLIVREYILVGDVTSEIIEIAKKYEASMIIMGTHGRKGFDHFISGSVAESVIRHAKCPVLIVPNK
ncbi:universal stress protein UspA [Pedobacter psychrophilus]|uniref:Universal stress protein n=1 Tax=Pedobacter psychrophilus TaxID=1826909 RepID=A0A179DF08_9SPHI|nr:universal stress protein [Pedobacter psychrophilus]OAQ39611.1 universal stress protein UspA [Pedobacter psychrophilus]